MQDLSMMTRDEVSVADDETLARWLREHSGYQLEPTEDGGVRYYSYTSGLWLREKEFMNEFRHSARYRRMAGPDEVNGLNAWGL